MAQARERDTLQLFDTLTREVKEITPIDGETFRVYCCGPTVYGPAHIGNFRAFVLQDVLRRVMELAGWSTLHVRNLTDVDDKTIRDSQAAGQELTAFTDHWRDRFHADGERLGLLRPHVEPSAVEHIPEQIEMISALEEKGHAYSGDDGSVYFRIASYPEYGRLSRLDEREVREGASARVGDADEYDKESIGDFVLWKSRKPEDGDNFWQSPWGEGRPGWHLECSAMSHKYLGEEFDLHAGGVDLVFPHHENEIAQSCCVSGQGFARHWFHNAHLMVDGKKMSKSKGNMYVLENPREGSPSLVEMGHDPMTVRYVLVSGIYRQQLNFVLDSLTDASKAMGRLAQLESVLREVGGASEAPTFEALAEHGDPGPFHAAWASLREDLNTPAALGHLFSVRKELKPAELSAEEAMVAWKGLHFILAAFGLDLPPIEAAPDAPAEVISLAEKRLQARDAKDWAAADSLRDEIAELGWVVKDSPDGFELTPS